MLSLTRWQVPVAWSILWQRQGPGDRTTCDFLGNFLLLNKRSSRGERCQWGHPREVIRSEEKEGVAEVKDCFLLMQDLTCTYLTKTTISAALIWVYRDRSC